MLFLLELITLFILIKLTNSVCDPSIHLFKEGTNCLSISSFQATVLTPFQTYDPNPYIPTIRTADQYNINSILMFSKTSTKLSSKINMFVKIRNNMNAGYEYNYCDPIVQQIGANQVGNPLIKYRQITQEQDRNDIFPYNNQNFLFIKGQVVFYSSKYGIIFYDPQNTDMLLVEEYSQSFTHCLGTTDEKKIYCSSERKNVIQRVTFEGKDQNNDPQWKDYRDRKEKFLIDVDSHELMFCQGYSKPDYPIMFVYNKHIKLLFMTLDNRILLYKDLGGNYLSTLMLDTTTTRIYRYFKIILLEDYYGSVLIACGYDQLNTKGKIGLYSLTPSLQFLLPLKGDPIEIDYSDEYKNDKDCNFKKAVKAQNSFDVVSIRGTFLYIYYRNGKNTFSIYDGYNSQLLKKYELVDPNAVINTIQNSEIHQNGMIMSIQRNDNENSLIYFTPYPCLSSVVESNCSTIQHFKCQNCATDHVIKLGSMTSTISRTDYCEFEQNGKHCLQQFFIDNTSEGQKCIFDCSRVKGQWGNYITQQCFDEASLCIETLPGKPIQGMSNVYYTYTKIEVQPYIPDPTKPDVLSSEKQVWTMFMTMNNELVMFNIDDLTNVAKIGISPNSYKIIKHDILYSFIILYAGKTTFDVINFNGKKTLKIWISGANLNEQIYSIYFYDDYYYFLYATKTKLGIYNRYGRVDYNLKNPAESVHNNYAACYDQQRQLVFTTRNNIKIQTYHVQIYSGTNTYQNIEMDASNPDLFKVGNQEECETDSSGAYICYPRSCHLYTRKGADKDTIVIFEIADIDKRMKSKLVVVNVKDYKKPQIIGSYKIGVYLQDIAIDSYSELAHLSDTFGQLYTIDFTIAGPDPMYSNKTLYPTVFSVQPLDQSYNSQIMIASDSTLKVQTMYPCIECKGQQCAKCAAGFKELERPDNTQLTNFIFPSVKQCFRNCPYNFYLDSSQCKRCDVSCDGCSGSGNTKCMKCSEKYSVATGTDQCIICDKTMIGYHKGGKGYECADLFSYMCMNLVHTFEKTNFVQTTSDAKLKEPSAIYMANITDLLIVYQYKEPDDPAPTLDPLNPPPEPKQSVLFTIVDLKTFGITKLPQIETGNPNLVPFMNPFLQYFLVSNQKLNYNVLRLDLVNNSSGTFIFQSARQGLMQMKYKGTVAIKKDEKIIVNEKDKGNIKRASTGLQNIGSVKSLYDTKRAFAVYNYKNGYIMMFDDDCKVALHKWSDTKQKYEFTKEIKYKNQFVYYPQFTLMAKTFLNQHDEVNAIVAVAHPNGDDVNCLYRCQVEFFTIEMVGTDDVKVIDRFLTPVKINLQDFYPIEQSDAVYIVSRTSNIKPEYGADYLILYYRTYYSDQTRYKDNVDSKLLHGQFMVQPSLNTSSGGLVNQQLSVYLLDLATYKLYSHSPLSVGCQLDNTVAYQPENIKSTSCRKDTYFTENNFCLGRCNWGYFLEKKDDYYKCIEAYPVYYNFTLIEFPNKFKLNISSTDKNNNSIVWDDVITQDLNQLSIFTIKGFEDNAGNKYYSIQLKKIEPNYYELMLDFKNIAKIAKDISIFSFNINAVFKQTIKLIYHFPENVKQYIPDRNYQKCVETQYINQQDLYCYEKVRVTPMVVENINPSQYIVTLDENKDEKPSLNPQIDVQKFYVNLMDYYIQDLKRLKFEI